MLRDGGRHAHLMQRASVPQLLLSKFAKGATKKKPLAALVAAHAKGAVRADDDDDDDDDYTPECVP